MLLELLHFSTAGAADYLAGVLDRFSADKALVEGLPLAAARELAEHQHRLLLPQGAATPHHHLRAIFLVTGPLRGTMVGGLWYRHAAGEREAFLYDICIEPEHRSQGFGRQALELVEEDLAAAGCQQLWLNVFARNVQAQRFYQRLGYEVGALHLQKRLARPSAD